MPRLNRLLLYLVLGALFALLVYHLEDTIISCATCAGLH